MRRRDALLGIGLLATHGLAGVLDPPVDRRIEVGIWETPAAADRPRARERAVAYLRRALTEAGRDVAVTCADAVVSFDVDDRTVEREAWPRRVLEGVAGRGPVEPVADVNLLLTDGSVARTTAGYAYEHVATVPGARYLAEMPPPNEVGGVVDYAAPAAVAQLVLHEVGHALGLHHRHGAVDVTETAVTASPMVSGYAWAHGEPRQGRPSDRGCGDRWPVAAERRRRLSLSYAPCAVEALRAYRGTLER